MKQIFFSLFMLLSVSVFAQDGKVTIDKKATYEQLHKQAADFSDQGLPKSALEVTEFIRQKAENEQNFAEFISAVKMRAALRMDIAPDSIIPDLEYMEGLFDKPIVKSKDVPQRQAILHAILVSVYDDVRTSRLARRNDELTAQCMEKVKFHTEEALKQKEALAGVSATPYKPLYMECDDSRLFNNDLLSLISDFISQQSFRAPYYHDANVELAHLNQIKDIYQLKQMRDAALLVQIRIWERQHNLTSKSERLSYSDMRELLKRMYEENADIETGADACMAYYKMRSFNSWMERLQFVRMAKNKFPKSPYVKTFEGIEKECFEKSVSVGVDGNVIAGQQFKIRVSHRNVPKVDVKVIDDKKKTVWQQTVTSEGFIDSDNYVEDSRTDTLFLSLSPGLYKVIASAENKQEESKEFRVSTLKLISYMLPGEDCTVNVVEAISGLPVKGCKVYPGKNKRVDGKWKDVISDTPYITDANGTVKIPLGDDGEKWDWAHAELSKDDISSRVTLDFRRNYEREIKEQLNYEVYTDRAVYRPGQTVYVSGYVYSKFGDVHKMVPDQQVDIQFCDANHQEIESKTVVTDKMGMASAKFVIPKGRLNGNFRIRFGDESTYVRVEEYKRPTFDIEFESQTGTLAFGDTAKVTGVAKTYFGVPVQGAKVSVKVQRKRGEFRLWWQPRGHWDNVSTFDVETDDDGRFTVDVFLDGDQAADETLDSWCRNFYGVMVYKVDAIVTDQAGETHEQSTSLAVSAREFSLKIEAPDNINRDKPEDIIARAVNVSGKEVPVMGTWKLEKYVIDDKGDGKYVDQGASGTFDTGKPIVIDGLRQLPLGMYRIKVETIDKKGNKDFDSHAFTLYSTSGGDITLNNDWVFTTDKEIGEGKGVDIYYAVAEKQPFVYAYVISDKKVEKRRIERLDNTIQHLHIDFKPEYKNGVTFMFVYVKNDKEHAVQESFTYVRPEKRLDIQWATFRDKLQPGQDETWTLTVKDKQGKPVKAQMLAAMYDASLDAIKPHSWRFSLSFPRSVPGVSSNVSTSGIYSNWFDLKFKKTEYETFSRCYSTLIPFDRYGEVQIYYTMTPRGRVKSRVAVSDNMMLAEAVPMRKEAMPMMAADMASDYEAVESEEEKAAEGDNGQEQPAEKVQMRSDFSETAFFYPDLMADNDGLVKVSFKLPESLTKWNFMAFAHTEDVDYGMLTASVVAVKNFMVQPNMPRFVRTGDKLTISTRIINQSENPVEGEALIRLIDPNTDKVVFTQKKPFRVDAQKTTNAAFDYQVPDEYNMLICEIYASDGKSSDGERNWLPILSDKKLITEAVPFYIHGSGTKTIDISTLFNNNSPTATQRKMVFDYTDNPAWNVVLALHGVANPKDDCAICWSTSLYVNMVAQHLANRMPRLQSLIRQWENEEGAETTMQSELEKNQELKDILQQEAPWMLEAQDETEQRHVIAELFNQNLINERISKAKDKLKSLQLSGGAWTWFKGMNPSYYTTFAVCDNLSMLQSYFTAVGDNTDNGIETMLQKGLSYLDKEELEDYEEYHKKEKKFLPGNTTLHYIYMVATAKHKTSGKVKSMIEDYLNRIQGKVKEFTMYGRANCAIALLVNGRNKEADAFVRSLREYTVSKPGMGRYYDTERAPYSWCDYKLPTHVAAMKAMIATRKDFTDAEQYLNDMQIWVIRQKQGQKWDSEINTIQAVDILLTVSPDTTFHEAQMPVVTMAGNNLHLDDQTAGIGFVKQPVPEEMVKAVMAQPKPTVTVEKQSPGLSWGTVYGQALESLDKVEQNGEALTVERKMYVYDANAQDDGWKLVDDNYVFKVGDKVRMRHIVFADRDLDFVQIRSQHAACLEPAKTRSGYQMLGGRGGYLALHDASADFFFDRFQKGTVTIDLEMYVTSPGSYANGIATVQCAYAPTFSGHSKGNRINVK